MTAVIAPEVGSGELGLHAAARSVLGRSATPINATEVAVILETSGYTANRARLLGCDGIPAMAQRVFDLLPLYSARTVSDEPAVVVTGVRPPGLADFGRGFAYSSPWLVGLVTMLVSGASFWSSNVAIPSIATAVTLATALALVVTGPFIQAFGRRASFYLGLGDQGMVIRITRWTLELGVVTAGVASALLFAVRALGFGAGTPGTTRLGVAAGLAIAALQVGFAAFYVRRAFVAITVVVAVGASALLWFLGGTGSYVDPTALIVWQIRLVSLMAGACWVLTAWWLLRVTSSAPAPLWRPSGAALVRAVAPYSLYGLAFFTIVVAPQLVSGGMLSGHFTFNAPFAMTSGISFVVVIPLLAQTVAVTEHLLTRQFKGWMHQYRISDIVAFRREVNGYWSRQLALVGALGAIGAAIVIIVVPRVGRHFPVLADLSKHPGLLAACALSYALLGVGIFCTQVLFTLSAPVRPLVAAGSGVMTLFVVAVIARAAGPTASAMAGLLAGTLVFALSSVLLTHRRFARADAFYYRAM